MRASPLSRRLDRLVSTQWDGEVLRVAHRLAAISGGSAWELLAETERMVQRCHHRGITSWDGMVRYWAAELGITPEELEREMACVWERVA